MIKSIFFVAISWGVLSCNGQQKPIGTATKVQQTNKPVGGPCDGCELMFVDMPKTIPAITYSPGWTEKGQKLLITGTVLQSDGRTPAPGVTLYFWQTDNNGLYAPKAGMPEAAKQHGHIRGWVQSDSIGRYSIYTIRPTPYPNEQLPAHIHCAVKEPNLANAYYIDDWLFDDDPLLVPYKKQYPFTNRGGSGLLRVLLKDSLQVAERNIVLGLHIPDYPTTATQQYTSGLSIGEESPSFMPQHAYGPDKGSQVCPVCKYGRYHGVLYFVGNRPNWEDIKKWLVFLENESIKRGKYLKAYFVYGNEKGFNQQQRQSELESLGRELGIKNMALSYVPSFTDLPSEVYLNKINPNSANTFVIYKHRNIIDKYINLEAIPENFTLISERLDQTSGVYFSLLEMGH